MSNKNYIIPLLVIVSIPFIVFSVSTLNLKTKLLASTVQIMPLNALKVAAIRIDTPINLDEPEIELNKIIKKIQTLIQDKWWLLPDLIVTPEYTLYPSIFPPNYSYPIKISYDPINKIYNVAPTQGAYSQKIINVIKYIQSIADNLNINFVLGTVPEIKYAAEDPRLGADVIFNTSLVIDTNGHIIGIKRKTKGSDWINSPSGLPLNEEYVYNLALDTTSPFTLRNRGGAAFKILSIICAERNNTDLLERAKDFKVDILVNSEREGDCPYIELAKTIQKGENPSQYPCWNWMIRDVFIKEFITNKDIIKENGYFVAAEGGLKVSGIFNLKDPPLPLYFWSFTDDWVYGIFPLPSK